MRESILINLNIHVDLVPLIVTSCIMVELSLAERVKKRLARGSRASAAEKAPDRHHSPEGVVPTIEEIQDLVERALMELGRPRVAKASNPFWGNRASSDPMNSKFMSSVRRIKRSPKVRKRFLSGLRRARRHSAIRSQINGPSGNKNKPMAIANHNGP